MSKRIITWIVFALVAIGAVVTFQRVQQANSQSEEEITFVTKSGDLAQFVRMELTKYGGTIAVTNSTPTMHAEWQYAEDSKGFQILLPQSYREEFIRKLTQLLGEPMNRDKYPHLVYAEDRFGVGIVADLEKDPIHIICLRKGAL